ncbi:MAG: RNA methyltransferase [Candidatus Pacebacteria bacterium]|nr:RNA methyltransferase [Candidatus Paceibacterota bacterium]
MATDFFAPAIPGTERALRDELCELGFDSVRLNRGGIPFKGEWADGWRACLQTRIAQSVQALMTTFHATTPEALYEGTINVDWTHYITPRQTLAVGSFCRSRYFRHSGTTALKVKDAVVDQIREAFGDRPTVDKKDPDVRLFVYVSEDRVKLYLDLAGVALHKRGYRQSTGPAPMRETLAAALLRMSGWDRESPLADPMCGSGTIAIEAALWAGNVAPGLFRDRFGFERWACFDHDDANQLRILRGDIRRAAHKQLPRIFASDNDETVLTLAKANAQAAGLRIRFRQADIADIDSGIGAGIVVTNPPYSERLETSLDEFKHIAAAFSRMHGTRVCILSGHPELEKLIPVAPLDRQKVKNGNLECEFLRFDVP